ncbi:MAG TPA: sulfite exporter TauE/SafE family protein [Nitrospiraceae bacterium]|nr:sulfite exporter TauE/SafE family protein [Nitrospiraceae bacterium]
MEFGFLSFMVSILSITLGAVLQASTGLGAGLVVVPFLALISLELVPGPVIFASVSLSSLMTYAGRHHIKKAHLDKVVGGLVIGMIVGILSLSAIPSSSLGLMFGTLILVAVIASSVGLKLESTPVNSVTAGAVSGFMGTTAAIGAPVLALLYQHEEGKTLRATLAVLYLFSSIGMLLLLHLAGRFGQHEFLLGCWLIPGFVLGYFLAGRIARMLDRGYSRAAVLVISSVSALILIAKSFQGPG